MDVRKLIDEKNIGEDVADTVGTILGLVLTLSPIVAGPRRAAAVGADRAEERSPSRPSRARPGRSPKSKPSDYLDRAERMAAANCLLVYVAFFDARPAAVADPLSGNWALPRKKRRRRWRRSAVSARLRQ